MGKFRDFLFCWSPIESGTESCTWNGNIFEINATNLPVALWNSLCTHYAYLPSQKTDEHHSKFAQTLLRFLIAFRPSCKSAQQSLYSVSDKFLMSGLFRSSPSFHVACLKSVEKCMQNLLDPQGKPKLKKLKSHRKSSDVKYRMDQLFAILRICDVLQFSVISSQAYESFSFSLIWKSVQFIMDHQKKWSCNAADHNCPLNLLQRLMNTILSVSAKTCGFWVGALLDLEKLRPRLIEMTLEMQNEQLYLDLLDSLNVYEHRIVMAIIDSGDSAALYDALDSVKQMKGISSMHLYPVFVDILIQRLHIPKVLPSLENVLVVLFSLFDSASASFLDNADVKIPLENLKLLWSYCLSIQTVLKRRKMPVIVKFLPVLNESLSRKRVGTALKKAGSAENQTEFDACLSFIALHIEASKCCRPKLARKVICLVVPDTDARMEAVEDEKPEKCDEAVESMDEVQLLNILTARLESIKSSEEIPVRSVPACPYIVASTQYSGVVAQLVQHCDPKEFSQMVLEVCQDIKISESLTTELSFYKVLMFSSSDFPEAMRPFFEWILERISMALSLSDGDFERISEITLLTRRMLKSSVSRILFCSCEVLVANVDSGTASTSDGICCSDQTKGCDKMFCREFQAGFEFFQHHPSVLIFVMCMS